MGIPRPKRMLPAKTVRSHHLWTTTPLSEDVDLAMRKPQCLVWVRTYCEPHRKAWKQCLRRTGVTVAETLPLGDKDTHGHHRMLILRIVGMPNQLEQCVMCSAVEKYEYCLSGNVPQGETYDEGGIPHVIRVSAQGAGEPKVPHRCTTMQQVHDKDDSRPKYERDIVDYPGSCKPKPTGKVSDTQDESLQAAVVDSYKTNTVKPSVEYVEPDNGSHYAPKPKTRYALLRAMDLTEYRSDYPMCNHGTGI